MDLREFIDKRDNLVSLYERTKQVASKLGNEKLVVEIKEAESFLLRDDFKIVVVGEFSRGKSTFINALLGKKVLPAKTNPTTTIINIINYGVDKKFVLHFRDTETTCQISEEAFKTITAVEAPEDDSDESLKKFEDKVKEIARIKFAEIAYPLELCKNGIEIVDTPGTNDLDQVREEITFKFIPEADAAIMLLSAEQILSRSEVNFLEERILKNDIDKVFFVINFKDRLENENDGERIKVLAYNELKKCINKPRVFLVSSKHALNKRRSDSGETVKGFIPNSIDETGFKEFETSLADYLIREKSGTKLKKYISRLERLCNDLLENNIKIRERNIGSSVQELTKELERMKPILAKAREESHSVLDELKTNLRYIGEDFAGRYKIGLMRVSRQAIMTVNGYSGELTPEAIARAIESATAPLQWENYNNIKQEMNSAVNEQFAHAHEKLKRIFKDEKLTISTSLAIVDNHLNNNHNAITISTVDQSDFSLLQTGIVGLGAYIALTATAPFIAIPAVLFGGKFFMQQLEEYRKADFINKVAMQVHTRYEEIIPTQETGFKNEMYKRADSVTKTIQTMIDNKINSVEQQYQDIIERKRLAAKSDQEERLFLKDCEQEIKNINNHLNTIAL